MKIRKDIKRIGEEMYSGMICMSPSNCRKKEMTIRKSRPMRENFFVMVPSLFENLA